MVNLRLQSRIHLGSFPGVNLEAPQMLFDPTPARAVPRANIGLHRPETWKFLAVHLPARKSELRHPDPFSKSE
jgi:hypothetical protein